MARALVGHLSEAATGVPTGIIEKLAQLGIKVTVKSGSEEAEVKTTEAFRERMTQTGNGFRPIPCMSIINGHPVCWSPLWELHPPTTISR